MRIGEFLHRIAWFRDFVAGCPFLAVSHDGSKGC